VLDSQTFAITTSQGAVSVYKCGQDNYGDFDAVSLSVSDKLHGLKHKYDF